MKLPQPVPANAAKRSWLKPAALLLVLLLALRGGAYKWLCPRTDLPPGIAAGKGRIEADEIDIDTKFVGRIIELFADEGDLTTAREVPVSMDSKDL